MMTLDHKWSLALYRFAKRHALLRVVSVFCASLIIWFLAVAAIAVTFTSFERFKYLVGVLIIGGVLNLLLGKIHERKRPFDTHKYDALISTWWLGGSFPSDHAMFATVFGSTLFFAGELWTWVAVASVLLVCLSRVFVGVHYISDVLAGLLVGSVAVTIMLRLVPILG